MAHEWSPGWHLSAGPGVGHAPLCHFRRLSSLLDYTFPPGEEFYGPQHCAFNVSEREDCVRFPIFDRHKSLFFSNFHDIAGTLRATRTDRS
jgi:hypothetical protein